MERVNIESKLTDVFRRVFDNDTLVLKDNMSANDVDNWDSLTHMILITEIEETFVIKFKLKELNKMRNVGDLINLILQKF